VRSCTSVDVGSRHGACSTGTLAPGWAGVGWRIPWGFGTPRPLPGRSGLLFDGSFTAELCAADRDAVEGFPWPGRRRGRAQLGSRSPGLPLAAAVLPPWKATQCNALVAPASRPGALRSCCCAAALTPAPAALASLR